MKFLIVLSVILGVSFGQFHQGPRRQNFQQQDQYQNVDQQQNDEPQPQQTQNQYKPQPQANNYQSNNYQGKHESTTFIPIIRFDKEQGNDGSYKAAWETGNNILAQEEGFLKSLGPNPDSPDGEELNAQVQQGSYTYTSPEGQIITVHYTADEKGFHPTGDHLPTPPPVSPEVQKGLDLIYAGIRAQQEAAARDPQAARQQAQDYTGQYNQNQHQQYQNQNQNQNNNQNNQQQYRQ